LVTAAGGNSTAGSKLKSSSGWNSYSGISSTDEYGFSALPGGLRSDGRFNMAGFDGNWWTATEIGYHVYIQRMYYNNDNVYEDHYDKDEGFSVRCVQN